MAHWFTSSLSSSSSPSAAAAEAAAAAAAAADLYIGFFFKEANLYQPVLGENNYLFTQCQC